LGRDRYPKAADSEPHAGSGDSEPPAGSGDILGPLACEGSEAAAVSLPFCLNMLYVRALELVKMGDVGDDKYRSVMKHITACYKRTSRFLFLDLGWKMFCIVPLVLGYMDILLFLCNE
jgi:hypothetical protein